jgi:hypothetical protein
LPAGKDDQLAQVKEQLDQHTRLRREFVDLDRRGHHRDGEASNASTRA